MSRGLPGAFLSAAFSFGLGVATLALREEVYHSLGWAFTTVGGIVMVVIALLVAARWWACRSS